MLTHQGTKTLTTQRLALRRFRSEDAQAMFENWASDCVVTKYLSWPTHTDISISRAVLADWISGYERENSYQWAITVEDVPIGSIGVVSCDARTGCVEVGYCIGRAWWHQGITSEALKAVINFLFEEVGANRIQALHDVNNPYSGGVMKKCGMEYEGTLRQYGWNNQGICDVCVYATLRNE